MPKCVVCRQPVQGDTEGVAFGVSGRLLFVACHAHAHVVRTGVRRTGVLAAVGAKQLVAKKWPKLFKMLEGARRLTDDPA